MGPVSIRDATPADYDGIRSVTLAVYVGEGLAGPDYQPTLADVEDRARHTDLVVALAGDELVGSVALAWHGSAYAEITAGPEEAAFRMLAVSARARGRGIGRSLVQACVDRARAGGVRRIVISSEPAMQAAHRLYASTGFTAEPARDWSPYPGVDLLCYVLDLAQTS